MLYRFIKLYFLLILFLALNTFVVQADTTQDLINKLNTIESRIKVLEKATFNKTTSGLDDNVSLDDYQSVLTRQSIQINELQIEIQSLTAQLEEVLFTLQSTINNFNTFREDTEFRFIDVNNKANELEKVQSLNLSQNSDEMAIVSEDIQNSLEPQSLMKKVQKR